MHEYIRAAIAPRAWSLLARAVFANLTILGLSTALSAHAADASPIGLWLTIDDNSGKACSHMSIHHQDGALYGKIEKIPIPGKTDRCLLCTAERKDISRLGW